MPPRPRPAVREGIFERPPLGYSPVHCFRCGRRGLVPSRSLLTRTTRDLICPTCRDTSTPAPPGTIQRVVPPAPNAPRPAGQKPLLGRPPLILVRSKELAQARAPALDGMVAVRCFKCGRAGKLPLQANTSLRPEDIICPTCRPRPGNARPRPRGTEEKSGRLPTAAAPVFG